MGCLNVNISELGYRISPSISWLGGVAVDVFRADKPINCGITDTGTHLRINCGIICSVNNHDEYLRVSPKDIQWITKDIGVFYTVESNTNWEVVTN